MNRRLFCGLLALAAVLVSVGCQGELVGQAFAGATSHEAQAPTIVHVVTKSFSRHKPPTGPLAFPVLPEEVESEAWLLQVGDRVERSAAITRDRNGTEVQRTVIDADNTWIYFPLDGSAQRLPGSTPLVQPDTPVGTPRRIAVTPAMLAEQRESAYVTAYYADLSPVALEIEADGDPREGRLARQATWAVQRDGTRTLIQESRVVRVEILPVDRSPADLWPFVPPPGVRVVDLRGPAS